jgi:hypothetical protein
MGLRRLKECSRKVNVILSDFRVDVNHDEAGCREHTGQAQTCDANRQELVRSFYSANAAVARGRMISLCAEASEIGCAGRAKRARCVGSLEWTWRNSL